MPLLRHRLAPATSIPGSSSVATTLAGPESKPRCFCPILCSFQLGTVSGRAVVASGWRCAYRWPWSVMGLPWLDREERGAPQRHAEAFLSEICHLPTRQTARFLSVLRVSSVGCPVAFCGVLQALLVSRRQQKTGAKAGFSAVLCSPGNAWEVRMVPRERLELSLCRQKRILNPPRLPIPPPRQWRRSIGGAYRWSIGFVAGKHISGKLRGLSRVSPCVSPIFISTCPRP